MVNIRSLLGCTYSKILRELTASHSTIYQWRMPHLCSSVMVLSMERSIYGTVQYVNRLCLCVKIYCSGIFDVLFSRKRHRCCLTPVYINFSQLKG